jgi:SAM-dependent methyltransferase
LSLRHCLWLCAALLAPAGGATAQDTGTVFEAPYVPSPFSTVDEMLRLAEVGPRDVVYDLGAGDGRMVIAAAAKFGARGVGVERDGELVAMARERAARAGVAGRVRFLQQDMFRTDLSEATVVALYLSPNLNLRLRPALLALAPGTRVVSHSSGMGDWRPDRRTAIRKDVLLWIVPAHVAGRWRARVGGESAPRELALEFGQRYQDISASAVLEGAQTQVWEARLEGDRLSFVLVEHLGTEREAGLYFEGRVAGRVIEGSVARGVGSAREVVPWRADR